MFMKDIDETDLIIEETLVDDYFSEKPLKHWFLKPEHNKIRGKIIFDILDKYLYDDGVVIDIACGYSPTAKIFLENNYQFYGFDIRKECISYLQETYQTGKWSLCSYTSLYSLRGKYDVVLMLGATKEWETFNSSISNFIYHNKPKIFFLETTTDGLVITPNKYNPFVYSKEKWGIHDGWNAMIYLLLFYDYQIVKVGTFDSKMPVQPKRLYLVAVGRW